MAQLLHRHARGDGVLLADGPQELGVVAVRFVLAAAGLVPGAHGSFLDAALHVQDQLRVELLEHAQAAAVGAGPVGAVEAEGAGLDLWQAGAALDAGEVLAEDPVLGVVWVGHVGDDQRALAQAQGRLHRVGQAGDVHPGDGGSGMVRVWPLPPDDQPVHHRLDVVHLVAVQLGRLAHVVDLAVHPHPHETLPLQALEEGLVVPLAVLDQGGQDHQPGAFGHLQDAVHDLLGRLLADGLAAGGAVGLADPGVEEAQVVVDLRDRAHGGAGVAAGALLVDGDGRAQPLDLVHVRLLHQAQELAGVGGEGLHVAALALRVDGVEGQAALAAAAQPGDHHQLVPGNGQVDVFQVVFPGAAYDQLVQCHGCSGFQRCLQRALASCARFSTPAVLAVTRARTARCRTSIIPQSQGIQGNLAPIAPVGKGP